MHSKFPYESDLDVLSDENLAPTPLHQVLRWLEEAIHREQTVGDITEPTAMQLATVDVSGQPSIRTVFMRFLDGRGPGFVTFRDSRKARELVAQPKAALRMGWLATGREITFSGQAEEITAEELDAFWLTRPRGAQITALASTQSGAVRDRDELEQRWEAVAQRFGEETEIPRPENFIGFRLAVTSIEFLSMRDNRLNDRFYLTNPGGLQLDEPGWHRTRLQP